MTLKKKLITISFIMILLLAGLTTGVSVESTYKIIYVDDDNTEGPWDGTLEHPYRYIQDAIDNASYGDTIRVYAGVYDNPNSNVYITQTLSIIGNGSSDTFIERPVSILADKVFFRGFTIDGFDYETLKKACCIRLKNSDNCDINNNTIATGLSGIELYDSNYNNIENNILVEREVDKPSIYLFSSNTNTIRRNHIDINPGSPSFGIYLDYCQNNIIDDNTMYGPYGSGEVSSYSIFLLSSDNNTIIRNNFTNCHGSIKLISSDYNKIKNNTIKNPWIAMTFYSSNSNIISGNIMSKLDYGISLRHSSNNTIDENIFTNSEGPYIGVWRGSNNNVISRNSLVNNTRCGIALRESCNNIIESNDIIRNNGGGIKLYEGANNNTICQNNIQKNGYKTEPWTGGIIFDGESGKNYGNTICWNNIQNNNVVGLNLSFRNNNNIIEKNNFIGNNRHAFFEFSLRNTWDSNYWDNWIGFGPKLIFGRLGPFKKIPWVNFDWNPAQEPYDI